MARLQIDLEANVLPLLPGCAENVAERRSAALRLIGNLAIGLLAAATMLAPQSALGQDKAKEASKARYVGEACWRQIYNPPLEFLQKLDKGEGNMCLLPSQSSNLKKDSISPETISTQKNS